MNILDGLGLSRFSLMMWGAHTSSINNAHHMIQALIETISCLLVLIMIEIILKGEK